MIDTGSCRIPIRMYYLPEVSHHVTTIAEPKTEILSTVYITHGLLIHEVPYLARWRDARRKAKDLYCRLES